MVGETALTPFAAGRFQWFRAKHKLEHIKQRDIRALGYGHYLFDPATCERLNAAFKGSFFSAPTTRRSYFRAGEYYLAVFVDERDPKEHRLFHPQVIVMDEKLRYVAAIAPEVRIGQNAHHGNGDP